MATNAIRERMWKEAAGPVAYVKHVDKPTSHFQETRRRMDADSFMMKCKRAIMEAGWVADGTYMKDWRHPVTGTHYSLTQAYRIHLQETGCADV